MTVASPTAGPRWFYLHGFASGPNAYKGRVLADHYASVEIDLARLNLRLPSFERLRTSEMIAHVRAELGDERDRAVLFGSSLGGLVAARVSQLDARVCALVLLAPAFDFVARWRVRVGEPAWKQWQATGWFETHDYAEQRLSRVDFGFVGDMERLDAELGVLPDVRVPTLIVHGTGDMVVDVNSSRAWAAGKRHVHLVEVADAHELTASLPIIAQEADAFLAGFLRRV